MKHHSPLGDADDMNDLFNHIAVCVDNSEASSGALEDPGDCITHRVPNGSAWFT